jgi:hypothetical protein
MPKKEAMKGSRQATLAGVQKEMAKPRVAKSARREYANLMSPVLLNKPRKPPDHGDVERHFEGEV